MRKCNGAAVAGATAIRKQTKKKMLCSSLVNVLGRIFNRFHYTI